MPGSSLSTWYAVISGETAMNEFYEAPFSARHDHVFLGQGHEKNERKTWGVIVLCGAMMIAEIAGGSVFGSLALVADGLHMSTHAGAMLIAALVHPAARISKLVGARPLRWIGVRSYGIYLWHFPIIVLTGWSAVRGVPLGRAALQIAATLAIAAVSWRYLEDPIRHGALHRLWRRHFSGKRAKLSSRELAWAGAGIFLLGVAGVGLAGAATKKTAESVQSAKFAKTFKAKTTPKIAHRTVCRSVAHIGDSTSLGLESPEYLPDPRLRISAEILDLALPLPCATRTPSWTLPAPRR